MSTAILPPPSELPAPPAVSNATDLTYSDVAQHSTKQDLYVAIHDKVYDVTKFIDEHPGGEEVMLDMGGQDATEAFEDVGHSDEARETLRDMLVADLKRLPGDPIPKQTYPTSSSRTDSSSGSGMGITLYATIAIGAALAFGAYKYMESNEAK